jgi:hypothetical protein
VTILAAVTTDVGRIRLHRCKDGHYETRRHYRDLVTDELRDCRICVSSDQAVDWYRLCEARGATFVTFAEVVA